MFEQIAIDGAKRRNPWSFAASFTMQSVLAAAALVLPMMRVASIDTKPHGVLYLPRPVGSPEPVKQTRAQGSNASALSTMLRDRVYRVFQAPRSVPNHIASGSDTSNAPDYPLGPVGPGDSTGVSFLTVADAKPLAVPPPPEPIHKQPPPSPQAPQKVSEGVQASKLIFGPRPEYPPLAKQARITGAVRLAARISADGHIRDLRLMSGHPMLAPAAIQAVSRWVYSPTLLNGQPVEVLTDIVVNFVLNQ